MPTSFSPGFRVSTLDLIVLVAGMVGVFILSSIDWSLSFVVGIPLVHFFLFCNVFRVSRALELVWAGIFISLAGATIVWDVPGWWLTAATSLCVAAVVIVIEMRKSSYHGVGWQRINPDLPLWWSSLKHQITVIEQKQAE